jgi:hypothetical protein
VCRRYALDLFLSTECSLRVFNAKAQEQVAKNRLLSFTVESSEDASFSQFAGYPFHGSGLFPLTRTCLLATEDLKKLPLAAAVSEPKHIEDSWQYGAQFEILYRQR